MIRHYIKTAFRNLLKYKAQNIISIIGLSVGILCFSICLYCSRYINSTDQVLYPLGTHCRHKPIHSSRRTLFRNSRYVV